MENPCKIVFFGDAITTGVAPLFENVLKEACPDKEICIVNAGVPGETSRDGLKRVDHLVSESPQVVVIGFGMNDWRKGVDKTEFKQNLLSMVDAFEERGARVILMTISPGYERSLLDDLKTIDEYNRAVIDVAMTKKVKVADVSSLWKKEMRPITKGLRDKLHPNERGYEVYCKALLRTVPRRTTTLLWQYNGHEAKCNYKCPYCYYSWAPKMTDYFFGSADQWHNAFKRSFGNQNLIFYLAFGEPTIGAAFYDVVSMIESEPNWELKITSNVSAPLERLVNSRLAQEKRLHINASFHPYMTSIGDFLKRILFIREHGIEVPVIYVMYPPLLKRFEADFRILNEHNFLVHVRKFNGSYGGRCYPYAYTDEERRFIAKYCDDATITYMLNLKYVRNHLSYSGMHFFVVDSVGNVGLDSDKFPLYSKYRVLFGNILQDNFKPSFEPIPYPGPYEGTVDGVSNLLELNYHELESNNVISFARQGGVYHTDKGIFYKNMNTDFTDSRIRAQYYFPPRNNVDRYFLLRHLGIKEYVKRWIR